MTTPDTSIVPAATPPQKPRRIAELDALSEACKDWLLANPDAHFADRDVVRTARDVADATSDLITYAEDSVVLGQKHRGLLQLNSAHVVAMLAAPLTKYGIGVNGAVR